MRRSLHRFLCLSLLVGLLAGCSSSARFAASSQQTQNVGKFYESGHEVLVSEKENSRLLVSLKRMKDNKSGHARMLVSVENIGDQFFNIDPKQIELSLVDDGKREPLEVYPPSEAAKKLTFNRRLAAALNAAAASYNAGAGVQSKNDELAAQNSRMAALEGASIEESLLRRNTVFPGEQAMGFAYFEFEGGKRLAVEVPIGGETHTFNYSIIEK